MLAGLVARLEVRIRGAAQAARLLQVPSQHRAVLFGVPRAVLLREPIGDGLVITAERRRGREPRHRLTLEVVLEHVLGLVGERAVRQPQQVVALDQRREVLLQDERVALGLFVPILGRVAVDAPEREQRAPPEHATHGRGVLEQTALGGGERGDSERHGVLDGERQARAGEPLEIDAPGAARRVLDQHARVEEHPHDVLEQPGRAAGHAHGRLDQPRRWAAATAREQLREQLDRVLLAQRPELDAPMPGAAEARPLRVLAQEVRPRRAHDQNRPLEALVQVFDELERVPVGVVERVEGETHRAARGVRFDEALQYRALQ